MGAGAADTSSGHLGREPFLAEMSSPQIRSLLERGGIDVLIPLGALEQHGPHLPLGTDTLIALAMATRVARRVGNLLIAPCLPVGCSDHHLSFAGTASLSEEVTSAYIRSVSLTLLRHGFRYAYIISGHAGNIPAMKKATSSLPEEVAGRVIAFVDWPTQRDAMHEWAEKSLGLSSEEVGSHSGHFETSVMLDLAPDLVNMSTAPRGFIGPVQEATRVMRDEGIAAVSDVGVVGDARRATSSAGSAYMEMLVRSLAGGIEQHRSTARGGF
jgi:creatinine amidohydrolase/Fe(II)-dependent formamide hydrolase-like protein